MHVLVTGGAGYIGSHTAAELLFAGHSVTVLDDFRTGRRAAITAVERLTGRAVHLFEGDVCDPRAVAATLDGREVDAVIHFAALKAVGESVAQPLAYYSNNVSGLLVLLRELERVGVRRLVFSSSATVYGSPATVPVAEGAPLTPANPYGQTKVICERVLSDLCAADPRWQVCALRYFNPAGAHPSGDLGEDPAGIPNNLMPLVGRVAVGRMEALQVFGDDYPTPDGTGVRDYIHVVDLARAHLRALECALPAPFQAINVGTGQGCTVLELIAAYASASGRSVPYRIAARRPGDVAAAVADVGLARELLGWQAEYGLAEICRDAWRWQQRHPSGFGTTQDRAS